MPPLLFSTIEVSRQAFHRTALSAAIVNLKPIVPGRMSAFQSCVLPGCIVVYHYSSDKRKHNKWNNYQSPLQMTSLFHSVQLVGRAVERAYKADGLTIACQDGKAAGQSVSHVHVHILPRRFKGDRFANNDDIYPTLEAHEKQLAKRVTHMEREQAHAAEQVIQLDRTPSSEASGGSGIATMGNVATPNEPIKSPGGSASGRSPSQEREPLRMDDEERKPRSLEEMEREAEWLKTFMKEVEDEASAISSTY